MEPTRTVPDRIRAAAPVLLACAALAAFAAIGPRLRAARARMPLRPAAGSAELGSRDRRSAALVQFASVALGGFRGVLADMLWIRAGRMQDERRFVELVQLSDWVSELEPRNEEVWIFQAWNMAYNVSFLLNRADDRWRWVRNGVSLLRDRGIPLNPGSSALPQALGWFFQHKIGSDSDEAAQFYRTSWAREIGGYLGEDGSAPPEGSFAEGELADQFRMDAALMRSLADRFGPVDWRVPDASALYWGWVGSEAAADGRDGLPCRRMVYQSLMSMARADGRLLGDPGDEAWVFGAVPAPALARATVAYAEECMAASSFGGIRHAYVHFLRDMAVVALLEGRTADARAFHGKLVAFFEPFGLARRVPPFDSFASSDPAVFFDLLDEAGFH